MISKNLRAWNFFSSFDRYLFRTFSERRLEYFIANTKKTHTKKLHNLGLENDITPCDPDTVIHNYSSVTLAPRIKLLLAFGLDFRLPIFKLDYYKYYLSFEKLAYNLKFIDTDNFLQVHQSIKDIANRFFHNFKSQSILCICHSEKT